MENKNIIIDNGTGYIKAGFSGEKLPNVIFPSIIGKVRFLDYRIENDTFIGDKAIEKRGILALKYPIIDGIIYDWENMEKIWNHTFYNELKIKPEEHTVLLTESPFNKNENKETMVQMMFETFNVNGLCISTQQILALNALSNNTCTALVLDSGETSTSIIPISNGNILKDSMKRLNIGGRQIKEYIAKILNNENSDHINQSLKIYGETIFKEIKENCTNVRRSSNELDNQMKEYEINKTYQLPDGQTININNIQNAPDLMFKPSINNFNNEGIQRFIYNSIMKCDSNIQNQLFSNIILSGGNTMFSGFKDRLKNELSELSGKEIEILASPDRKYSTWIGGSILSSLSNFNSFCISNEDYNEIGPSIIYNK